MKYTQQEIIELVDKSDYNKVWEIVKYVGYNIIPNIEDRHLCFCRIVRVFDANKNKSFTSYYKNQLKYNKDNHKSCRVSTNRKMVEKMIKESISPTYKDRRKRLIDELQNWMN